MLDEHAGKQQKFLQIKSFFVENVRVFYDGGAFS